MTRTLLLLRATFLRGLLLTPLAAAGALTLLVPSAHAGQVEKAEHTRLSEEMKKFAQRNAWTGVEKNYRALEELVKSGEVIEFKEHMLGAEAARALGDMTACRLRLERAIKVDPKKEALDWISEVDANYGRVSISIDSKYGGDRALNAAMPPFAPDQRAALATATARIAAGESYEGLLPAGDYTVGAEKLTVVAGNDKPVASVRLAPAGKTGGPSGGSQLAYVGPRATIGVAFTSAGETAEATGADGGPLAAPFGGAGARLGLGVEVGLSPNFGVIAEVGYHDLFGAPQSGGAALEGTDQFAVPGNSMHLGYGWLAASLRLGKVWLAAGPLWGAGTGTVTGAAGDCQANGTCDDTTKYMVLKGDVLTAGGAASVSYSLASLGKLDMAFTLEGGAQSDSTRMYPWAQAGLTLAPGTPATGGRGGADSRRTK